MARKPKRDLTVDEQLARGPMDLPFLMLVLLLLGIGLIMMFSASYATAYYEGRDPTFYFFRQGLFAVAGLAIMYVVSKINYQTFRWLSVFALILAICYKQFSWKMLYESLMDTAKTTAMVFIILFGAAAFTGVFMSLDGDQIISNWVLGMGIGKWGAFAIMMIIMFILGMFIDWLGIVMIVFPIFLPIMDQFGFDRLWLVAVSATLLQTCFMTPPFGFALFYVKGILPDNIKIQEVYKGVIPFIIIICIVTALCAVFPPVVTWLPGLLAA